MAPQTASHAAIELASFRERVIGIDGAMLATADGLCVASVALSVQPESMAALGAASLGVAWRIAAEGGSKDCKRCAFMATPVSSRCIPSDRTPSWWSSATTGPTGLPSNVSCLRRSHGSRHFWRGDSLLFGGFLCLWAPDRLSRTGHRRPMTSS